MKNLSDLEKKINSELGTKIKNSKIRPSFINRKHNGTDLFILGFKKPPKVKGKPYQPWNILLQRVILNNYFAALYDNELRVIITDENENRQYELNSNNVIEIMKKEYNSHKYDKDFISNFPFLDAYTNKDKIVNKGKIEGLGSCCFYIILKNDYKKRVSYMRKPKMMVYNKINPRLSTGYSALFMCESVNGNKFLSKLEGPTHSEWDSGYHNDEDKAKKIQRRISVFINEILKELKKSRGTGIDISSKAIQTAKINSRNLNLANRSKFKVCDLDKCNTGKYDLIVSNPPYILSKDIKNLSKDITNYEPKIALDGGIDGLDLIKKVIYKSSYLLKSNGMLALEIGLGQYQKISRILKNCGLREISKVHDYKRNVRCIISTKVRYI